MNDENKIEKWIAIGDIHASLDPLIQILDQAQSYSDHKLIFLGDYFDYGNELCEVLDTLIKIERPAIFLKGNHEEEFLNFYEKYGTNKVKRRKILNYFGIGVEHIDWLYNYLIYSYSNQNNCFFSHAGIDDLKEVNEQTNYDLIYSAFKENLDHVNPKLTFIQGHTIVDSVTCFGNHWLVDTGCGLGGKLSALVYTYPVMQILSSN